ACRYASLCPTDSESQNAMQQVRVSETVMQSRGRELLALREFGIGICLDEIRSAVGGEAKVDARISIEIECPVGPFGYSLNPSIYLRRKILGRPIHNPGALLVAGIVFDLPGGNRPCTLAQVAEFQLPH